ncbi:hypothetical protein E2C01_101094 [Portunus trituberculatus]|uniref:Uncharacterized protein n=1 Tax=Portunus trituberculatus TaxID=210409 RepID=A0A5B7KL44_PORTR|nr:hypothetical protein [Portunus trituberculatus]
MDEARDWSDGLGCGAKKGVTRVRRGKARPDGARRDGARRGGAGRGGAGRGGGWGAGRVNQVGRMTHNNSLNGQFCPHGRPVKAPSPPIHDAAPRH